MDTDIGMEELENSNNSTEDCPAPAPEGEGLRINLVHESSIPCESKESFYYAISLYLTRPETVWTKYLFSSFIHNFHIKLYNNNPRDEDDEDEIKRLTKEYEPIFYLPMNNTSIQTVFHNPNLCQVYIERMMIIRNKVQSQVLLLEIWDFKTFTITIIPKHRANLITLNHQILELERHYSKNLSLLKTEFQFIAETQEVRINAFGTEIDVQNSLASFQRILNRIQPWFQRSYQNWVMAEDNLFRIPSLSAVDRKNYYSIYQLLKQRYYNIALDLWEKAKEKTNGNKFIHEDLHVAAYLICLETTSNSPIQIKKKFVELACGNGLLTYILISEGWTGYGLDTRERRIWTYFPGMENHLRVQTVTMENMMDLQGICNETLIIGNHPDQLSPLIPIITFKRKAGGFIIIPCCAYDLYGNKATRAIGKSGSKISAYESHVIEVNQFSQKIGFQTTLDKLRLPSTKRIGILGSRNNSIENSENESEIDQLIFKIIQSDRTKRANNVPEPGIIAKSKNCSNLPRDQVEGLVFKIFNYMLFHRCQNHEICSIEKIYPSWSSGCKEINLKMIIDNLNSKDLELVKSQNKGIQTLLRNYGQVFKFEGAYVRIRIPSPNDMSRMIAEGKSDKLKINECFFEKYHPNSCPLDSSTCRFKHINEI